MKNAPRKRPPESREYPIGGIFPGASRVRSQVKRAAPPRKVSGILQSDIRVCISHTPPTISRKREVSPKAPGAPEKRRRLTSYLVSPRH
jgi:hypothetical protein